MKTEKSAAFFLKQLINHKYLIRRYNVTGNVNNLVIMNVEYF